MSDLRLQKISVDHFRGYREPVVFDIRNGSDLIILSGPNGMGKTSFFDAIEWGFTGKLFRFEGPNEEKNKNHFVNFQPFERPAEVKIEFGDGLKNYILTRKASNFENKATDYGSSRSNLTLYRSDIGVLEGETALNKINEIMIKPEWRSKIRFENVFSQYHLLTQDKLKYFINGLKGPERYNQISSIVGTERYLKYGDEFESIQKEIDTKITFINNELKTLNIQIDGLSNQITNEKKINIGIHKSVNEYIHQLTIESGLSIGEELDTEQEDTLDFIDSLQEKILGEKNTLFNEIFLAAEKEKKLQRLSLSKEAYKTNTTNLDSLTKSLPMINRGKNLMFVKENLQNYLGYKDKTNNLNKEIERSNDRLQEINDYLDFFISLTTDLKDNEKRLIKVLSSNNILEDKCSEVLLLLNNQSLNAKYIDDIIDRAQLNIDKTSYKQLGNIKENLSKNIKNIKKQTNDNVIELQKLIAEKGKIQEDIISVNTLDKKQKELLKESRDFLTNKIYENQKSDCPVCGTEFEFDELLKRIDNQLVSENVFMQHKLVEQKQLEQDIKLIYKYNDELTLEFNKSITVYQDKLKTIQLIFEGLREGFESEQLKIKSELNIIKPIISNLDQNYNQISKIIGDLNLDKQNINQLSNSVLTELNKVESQLIRFGLNLLELDNSNVQQQIVNLKIEIENYEKQLNELNIQVKLLDPNLDTSITKIHGELKLMDEKKTALELLEAKLSEIRQSVQLDRNRQDLKKLKQKHKEKTIELNKYVSSRERLIDLQDAVKKVVGEMNQKILREHEQFINNIFNRIYPHPYFRSIKFELETNNQGNNILTIQCLRNSGEELKVNPAYTFSTAQTNVVAISIFLALALRQQCTNLKAILLDDPIQSMDDLNIFSFIDILRSFTSEGIFTDLKKQIVMSTHDEKIYKLMNKKFRFLNSKSFLFKEYSMDGPLLG